MMNSLTAWAGQTILWARLGWPIAVWVWRVFKDGVVTREEVIQAIRDGWPTDNNGVATDITVPLMTQLRTK